jgi:hypothetical protein
MKTKIIVLLVLIPAFVVAQKTSELSFGTGPSFFGWGDITGYAFSTAYTQPISSHFGFEPRIIMSNAWRKYDASDGYSFSHTGYMGFAGSLVITPFAGRFSFFKIKSGYLYQHFLHSNGNVRTGEYYMNDSEFRIANYHGLIHTLHTRLIDRERFFVGSELSMLTNFSGGYYNCDGFILNIMAGIKF